MTERQESRGIGDLLGDLGRQVSTLVRKEIDLARVEVTSSVGKMSRGAAMAGAGGAILYAGLLVLLIAAVFGLVEAGIEPWLSALIVALVVLAIGGAITAMGVKRIQETELAPKETAETVKENIEYVKEQVK
ncbi:MAG TPA: phage holin family protein [Candidatus Limnocylindrales bacterium]|jgi:xanthine/uracil permease|nr:phage holin family protein [Candidatus Limnocylindrales bacterium]